MMKFYWNVCGLAVGIALASPAWAGSQTDFTAKLTDPYSMSHAVDGVYTGLYEFTLIDLLDPAEQPIGLDGTPVGPDAPNNTFLAHCIEYFSVINANALYEFDVVTLEMAPHSSPSVSPFDALTVTALKALWSMEFMQDGSGDYLFLPNLTGRDRHAAAQLAIWHFTDDKNISNAANAHKANATLFVDAVDDWTLTYPMDGDLYAMVSANTQDFLGLFSQPTTIAHAPMPASVWTSLGMLVFIGGVSVLRRRRGLEQGG